MTHREMSIGLFIDAMFSQLPLETRKRNYVAKTIVLFVKKHTALSRSHPHSLWESEKLAMQSWDDCQSVLDQEVAVTEIIRLMIKAEPWMIKRYKLNSKKLDRMYKIYKTDDIQFRSLRAVNLFRSKLDENIAQLKYRKGNK